ncbi:MAG: porin family protein [Hyphomicrobiales bacterium]|nr:porin family protein [Hyphomicrobiales bacterium]
MKLPDGSWIDAKTGNPVPTLTWPTSARWPGLGGDFTHAQNDKTGANLVRVPCPPPTQSASVPSTGLYIGLNTGVALPSSTVAWIPNFGAIDSPLVANSAMRTMSPTAFTFGGQVGIDFGGMATNPIGPSGQFGWTPDFVFGAVADFNLKTGSQTVTTPYVSPLGGGVFPMVQKFASPFEMTLRARAGVAIPVSPQVRVMPYVTGGLALATINTSDAMYFPTSFNFGASSQFRPGWTVGAGVGIMPSNWPVRVQVQYLYEDFGTVSYVAPNSLFANSWIATNHRINAHRLTVGLNIPLSVFGVGR